MKRILALVLTTALFMGLTIPAMATDGDWHRFTDVAVVEATNPCDGTPYTVTIVETHRFRDYTTEAGDFHQHFVKLEVSTSQGHVGIGHLGIIDVGPTNPPNILEVIVRNPDTGETIRRSEDPSFFGSWCVKAAA
jgi:hypothetical protein